MAFGAETTTDEVLEGIDLSGKVAIVTGASAGLGVETSRALAAAGAHLVLAVRNLAKGEQVAAQIRESAAVGRLEVRGLDLGSLASIRAFGAKFLADHSSLHLLINNAGVMATPHTRTLDGFDQQLGTNHLGHFALTLQLLPALRATAARGSDVRIVNLSSGAHLRAAIDWEDPHYRTRPYDKWQAYGQSKTANVLFTVELERRLAGDGIHSFAVQPGNIVTDLTRHLSRDDFTELRSEASAGRLTLRSVQAGAATSVWAATSPDLDGKGGSYLEDVQVAPLADEALTQGVAPHAVDAHLARRFWTWSEDQIGQAVGPPNGNPD
jgi:NAD(P)-dependent dehydrogenase (short-subunit alcohol dehydrogenase family)